MQISLSKELFLKVRSLSEKKRKNEEVVPMEQLTTKCNELRENQQQLRMDYMESIRILTDLVAESVYMDLSSDEGWLKLLQKCGELYKSPELLTRELIKAFLLVLNDYSKGDSDGK